MTDETLASPCPMRGRFLGAPYRPCQVCPTCGVGLIGNRPEYYRRAGLPTEGATWFGGEELIHPIDSGWIGDGRHPAQPDPWSATVYPGDVIKRDGRIVARYVRDQSRPVSSGADFGPGRLVPVIPHHWRGEP